MKSNKDSPKFGSIWSTNGGKIQLTHCRRRSTVFFFHVFDEQFLTSRKRHSLRGGGKGGSIDSRLNEDDYTVVSQSTLSEIVSLEVKGGLRETISNATVNGVLRLSDRRTMHL